MTAVRKYSDWISPEEYIEGELHSEVRHEYFAGDVVAMAGASLNHNRIAGDIHTALNLHFRGAKCEAFINDMKAHIQRNEDDWFYYPDVMVNCDPSGQKKHFCDTPCVIIEVLSPDTERIDRREKRLAYEMLPSLHTYILVEQDKRALTIYRKNGRDWSTERLPENGEVLSIPEIGFTMALDEIYRRVDFSKP